MAIEIIDTVTVVTADSSLAFDVPDSLLSINGQILVVLRSEADPEDADLVLNNLRSNFPGCYRCGIRLYGTNYPEINGVFLDNNTLVK